MFAIFFFLPSITLIHMSIPKFLCKISPYNMLKLLSSQVFWKNMIFFWEFYRTTSSWFFIIATNNIFFYPIRDNRSFTKIWNTNLCINQYFLWFNNDFFPKITYQSNTTNIIHNIFWLFLIFLSVYTLNRSLLMANSNMTMPQDHK